MTSTLGLLAVMALGLQAGALLAEGAVLVPLWRSLPAPSFLQWYRDNGALLLRFYGPLEIVAALVAILAAVASGIAGASATPFLGTAGILSVLVLATFPVYFQRANASFTEGTIELDRVHEELGRWARWHWGRVVVATAAFVAAASAM